ncbi:MAG: glycosyltransferase [Prevotella sp.]|nr:glycosyltransferase [Prevotella sp.]
MQDIQSNTSAQKAPLVSFIIPTYNLPAEMLRECLDSILALTLRPDEREIILVDDGSDVSPLAELNDYLDALLYIRQTNSGLSCARNSGLRMAAGKYVQFIDGDDKLLSAPYEHCLDAARFSNVDIVMFDFTFADKPLDVYEDLPIQSGTEIMRHQNLHGTACGYLFRRAILGELRFTPGIYHEDEEFTPQLMLRADTVLRTNARAYFYRKRQTSITGSKKTADIDKRINNLLGVILRLNEKADHLPQAERLAMMRRVHQLTMDYVYKVMKTDGGRLEEHLLPLRQAGLFPLPEHDYTKKYQWFRRLSSSKVGMALLKTIIPMTHEK